MRKHKGFTLIELVVVVMILGILAAVAAPKLLGTSTTASDNGLKESLSVVRDAIERYTAEHAGTYPGGADGSTLAADLATYLRVFPKCPVGPAPMPTSRSSPGRPVRSQAMRVQRRDGLTTPLTGVSFATTTPPQKAIHL